MGVASMTTELQQPPTDAQPPTDVDRERAAYERARKRVEDIRGYYIHLMIYAVVNAGLFLIDALTGGGWWFYWPLLGWGIGVGAHTVSMIASSSRFGPRWEERKIRELMQKDRG